MCVAGYFLISSKWEQTSMYVHTCLRTSVQSYGDPLFFTHRQCGSVSPSACRAPVPSVIHEPSAWASAVSDVCQIGPHQPPLFTF